MVLSFNVLILNAQYAGFCWYTCSGWFFLRGGRLRVRVATHLVIDFGPGLVHTVDELVHEEIVGLLVDFASQALPHGFMADLLQFKLLHPFK